MFMRKKNITNTLRDTMGKVLTKTTKTIYLLDGQVPDSKTMHPEIQKQYKKLYNLQETKSLEQDRPISIFEVLGLI